MSMHSPDYQGVPTAADKFYRRALLLAREIGVPFLVGGGWAYHRYTGVARQTKDLDLFLLPEDCEHFLQGFADRGYRVELTYPHWLGKVFGEGEDEDFIDVIFSSGNGIARVDAEWFKHAEPGEIEDLQILLCPVEEMIWSKSFVMERERYDGHDIVHLLHVRAEQLDWERLLRRFGPHWRILLQNLILFGFAYPAEQKRIPQYVMQELLCRLQHELHAEAPSAPVCQGTLLSREQYRVDVDERGLADARIEPTGRMTADQIAHWTAAIDPAQR